MKICNTEICGFNLAIHGMRNSRESWDKSDSLAGTCANWSKDIFIRDNCIIGSNDLALTKKLIKAGTEHRKFLRQIMVWADFTLPLYIWSEFDTYKIGVTRNSCSTVYNLGKRILTQDDFQSPIPDSWLNELRIATEAYQRKKIDLVILKNLLPSGYLLESTISMNYENVLNIIHQREHHILPEWSGPGGIIEWAKSLPYIKEFISP